MLKEEQQQQQQQQQQGQESQPGPAGSAFAKEAGNAGLDGGAVTPSGCVNGEETKEFLSTGRTGRRNAMPHVFGRNAELGTAELPEMFEALTTDTEAGPSCSGSHGDPGASSASQSG